MLEFPTKLDPGEPFSLSIFFDAETGEFIINIKDDPAPIVFDIGTGDDQTLGETGLNGDMDITFTGYAEEGLSDSTLLYIVRIKSLDIHIYF